MTETYLVFPISVRVARGLRAVARSASLGIAFIGAVALATSFAELKTSWSSIEPLTAIGFILSGISLRLLVEAHVRRSNARHMGRQQLIAVVAAALVAAIGLLHLAEFFMTWYAQSRIIVQMGPTTALCLLSAGLALIFLGMPDGARTSQFLALTIGVIGFLHVFAVAYGTTALYDGSARHGMSLMSSMSFIVLGTGILCARTSRGFMEIVMANSLGGLAVRRIVPAAIVISFVVGWIRLRAEQAGYISLPFGTSLLTLTNMITFVALTWWTARLLHKTDMERKRAENALRAAHDELEKRVDDRTAELAHLYEETKDTQEKLRALAAHIESVREDERTRIAREIHDELGQELTALKMDLLWIEKRMNREVKGVWSEKILSMGALVDDTIRTVRRIATELRPSILDDLGLVAAMEWQAADFQHRTGIRCDLMVPESEIPLDFDRATAVFRIFQETLTNVVRHAQATQVDVQLRATSDEVQLRVTDNGRGISRGEILGLTSLGILGMRERAQQFGGDLDVAGLRGRGTTVIMRVPLMKHESQKNAPE